eukprot:TRINITY_DN121661_c0_g1_i1.p1 TRINITY_DN121661_c0_g1~~TRINITY_DN121661_c0_g1_i1.p1  ORF type:complete len:560 (-),score=181.37 TRINITY_DN121661_c0_g1_i1:246-1925(-)
MGKNQHSKDTLHQRPTEWAEDGRGFKAKRHTPFAKLPLNCCALSLQPFDKPVGTRDGNVFEAINIVGYIKKFGKNPITGGKLEVSDLIPLQFHKNPDGKLHCPVTFKEFTNNSHVAANAVSGHVYSFEAMNELNRKNKNFLDLITSQKFSWQKDLIILQDPDAVDSRLIAKFYYMKEGQQDEVIKTITHKIDEKTLEEKKQTLRHNSSIDAILQERKQQEEEKAKAIADAEAADPEAMERKKQLAAEAAEHEAARGVSTRHTSGEVAASFTSSRFTVKSQNELRKLSLEEETQELYDFVRKKKLKGYVRVRTNVGLLNLELHCDFVPRTCDNFLRLCEKDYYNNTVFHRLIHNFMLQGGDPTGTGRGGESGFPGGKAFRDEFDSRLTHQGGGIISMANSGKNTNKSQFFVTLKSCQHLDNKHSIFGRVVGGLELLKVFNEWPVGEKDRPTKELKILGTDIFKHPFKDAIAEMKKPKEDEEEKKKKVEPSATWFSNRRDPMEEHKNRSSNEVGKYIDEVAAKPLPGQKRAAPELPTDELAYVNIAQKPKKQRTSFDFSKW